MKNFQIQPIGKITKENDSFFIQIEKNFCQALSQLNGFSHLQILWWANLCDFDEYRQITTIPKPYKNGPDTIGIFATRSPIRPNPIMLSVVNVLEIDFAEGKISIDFIDAECDSPVLDIKPYFLFDRIKNCKVPDWCKHWPEWHEDTLIFNWQNEFNF